MTARTTRWLLAGAVVLALVLVGVFLAPRRRRAERRHPAARRREHHDDQPDADARGHGE